MGFEEISLEMKQDPFLLNSCVRVTANRQNQHTSSTSPRMAPAQICTKGGDKTRHSRAGLRTPPWALPTWHLVLFTLVRDRLKEQTRNTITAVSEKYSAQQSQDMLNPPNKFSETPSEARGWESSFPHQPEPDVFIRSPGNLHAVSKNAENDRLLCYFPP